MTEPVQRKITSILRETQLPTMAEVLGDSKNIAASVEIGRSLFMQKFDVASEFEYKKRCIKEGRIMYHAHIGMNSWAETMTGLRKIYDFAEQKGFIIDRAGICLDRRMALPTNLRKSAPQESGPYLADIGDWKQIGQVVPIQPHMGDFIIGFPASTENTVAALSAGVTTIGNLSQFFAHEAPVWKRLDITTVETVKAIGIIGCLRDRGILMHSYLDDGYGALFLDCATNVAWAYLEKYIVEDLLGAKLSHCAGGLVSDPIKRSAWVFALDEIHNHDCVGSMFYGNTISSSRQPGENRSYTMEYLLWDIMSQLECPTGHAVLPVPLTEALRAPSAEEICEAQELGREAEKIARGLYPHFDFTVPKELAKTLCVKGKKIFNEALSFFEEYGVNTKDAVQLLYVLKSIGARDFENSFNPVVKREGRIISELSTPNDIFLMTLDVAKAWESFFISPAVRNIFSHKKILLASTDVHEHGILLIDTLLKYADAEVINIGSERGPDEVARAAAKEEAEILFISTHNGMALEYAKILLDEMTRQNRPIPVCMGGVLNQKSEAGSVPVDVSGELEVLGITIISDFGTLPECADRILKVSRAGRRKNG